MCGLALLSALSALLRRCGWLAAIIANLVALSEVVLEMVIKTTLAGPHTASGQARSFFPAGYVYTINDDVYHGSLLTLITISLFILSVRRSLFLQTTINPF